jgi:hypothetical protein
MKLFHIGSPNDVPIGPASPRLLPATHLQSTLLPRPGTAFIGNGRCFG